MNSRPHWPKMQATMPKTSKTVTIAARYQRALHTVGDFTFRTAGIISGRNQRQKYESEIHRRCVLLPAGDRHAVASLSGVYGLT